MTERHKLLDLYYEEKISAELFAEEEQRLVRALQEAQEREKDEEEQAALNDGLVAQFDRVAGVLQNMDVEAIWGEATDGERRVLVEELLESVDIFPDHLEVKVEGAPRLMFTWEGSG